MNNNYILELYFDKPIEYKNLRFYPIKVKDYYVISFYSTCLTIDKNATPEGLKYTYLDYLFKLTLEDFEKNPYLFYFDNILKLTLLDNQKDFENIGDITSFSKYKYDDKNKAFFTINNIDYNNTDFLAIRDIIAEQNGIELIDDKISKDVRDSLEKARRYKEKQSGKTKPASLEDLIVSLSVATGWSFEYVYNLSIRKFLKSIERLDNLIHYKIYLQASMSGMVEFKDKSFIKHWLSNLEKQDKYEDVSVDVDSVKEKINFESAKKNARRK